MKLLSKYNRINIPIIISGLLISGIAYYFILHILLVHQLNHDLEIEEQEIRDFALNNDSLPAASIYKDQQIAFDTLYAKVPPRRFSSEKIYEESENETHLFRQLAFPVTVKKKEYQAIVRKSQEGIEDLLKTIIIITLFIIVLLLAVLLIVNRFILGKLWKPFNSTLEQLKQFNISSKNKLQLKDTNITEFAELNKTVLTMTDKVSNDYDTLKSFTENASHEIQTPLAIIKMKLELLLQSENMSPSQVDYISSIADATDRLSRLNQSLLLLTKIDNSQFIENEKVNISEIILSNLNNYEELAASKNIFIKKNVDAGVYVFANRSLMEILISNIMTNTIKHNYKNGCIEVILANNVLSVSNTGEKPSIKIHELFERFKKGDSSKDSLGLGLAIVKRICETYDFDISYKFSSSMHTLKVQF